MRPVNHTVYDEIERGTSARMTFKWQSLKERERLTTDSPFQELVALRPVALRPIYWEIISDAYTRFNSGYELEVRDIWKAP